MSRRPEDIEKRARAVLGPDTGRMFAIAEALSSGKMDAAVIEAFGSLPDGGAADAGAEFRAALDRPRSPSRVVEVDLSGTCETGKLKAFGGAMSDRANALVIGKTVAAVSADDAATVAAMKELAPRDLGEGMLASLAVASYAAAMDSFAYARRARPIERGEHLAHATRCSMTHAALVDALQRTRDVSSGRERQPEVNNEANVTPAVNEGLRPLRQAHERWREGYNASQRNLMRRRRAVAKARQQMDA